MRDKPKRGERYRHFKNNEYEIVATATHTETHEELVIYFPVARPAEIFARPLTMFMSEVDHEKYPEVSQLYRFEKIADAPINLAKEIPASSEGELDGVSPLLLEFLDAETYEKKLEVFDRMKMSITNDIIDAIAVSLDTEVDANEPVEERYRQVREILLMQEKYETTRLRG